MKKMLAIIGMILALSAIAMTGCGKSGVSEKELKSILPYTITDYEFGDEYLTQEVSGIDIIKADIEDNYEYMECDITLKDEHLERIVHAQLELTDYEVGGWQVDSWMPLGDETIISVAEPDSSMADGYMDRLGYTGMAAEETYTDGLINGYYEKKYSVNETHEFADFSGTAVYTAELAHVDADGYYCANYNWIEEADLSQIETNWKVEGLWEGTEIDPYFGRPDKYEMRIDSIDSDGNVEGTGKYYFPAFDGNTYLGRFGNYDYSGASASFGGASPSDASLTISVGYEAEWIRMTFTPDDLTVTATDLMGDQEFDHHRS